MTPMPAETFSVSKPHSSQNCLVLWASRRCTEPVVIIDEYLANKQFAGRDPIGRFISQSNDDDAVWWRVIGVVGTVKTNRLDQTVEKETIYRPIAQFPQGLATLVVRSPQDAQALTEQLRSVLQSVDHHRREAPHELVAQVVVRVALATETCSVEGHGADDASSA